MNTQELKEQAHKEFDEKFGEVYSRTPDGEEMNYHFLLKKETNNIKSFIDSLIDRTVQQVLEEERKRLKCFFPTLKRDSTGWIPEEELREINK